MGNPKIKSFFLPAVFLLGILACSKPSPQSVKNTLPSQPVTNTASVIPTATTQLPTATVMLISATATAAPTLTPTIAPTSSIPMVMVSVGTNCRAGPGIIYDLVDGLMVGEQAEIVRLAPLGIDYVVIIRPHGPGECWLWLQYATITGDTSRLPLAIIPPTPTSTTTLTPTSTDTVAPPSPFGGVWNMKVFEKTYAVTLIQTGNSITGTFLASEKSTVSLTGIVDADGKTVTGSFDETQGLSGTFTWYLLTNTVQFTGHGDIAGGGRLPWCGYRDGQSAPEPCKAP